MQDPAVTMGIKSIDVLVWIMTLHLFSTVKVNSQEFPYVSFMGTNFTNHSYINASLVGSSESNSVQCHTNVDRCCTSAQGQFRGDWFHPNGSRLGFSFNGGDIYQTRGAQRVDLFRRNNANANGIFFCNISVRVESVGIYMGLYTNGGQFYVLGFTIFMLGTLLFTGSVTIQNNIVFNEISDLNGASPQFTLTCISTGGPATTVTWTRGSDTVTEGTETVLDDQVTAQYTHTLTVTGRLGGLYTCNVSNSRPSSATAELHVTGTYICQKSLCSNYIFLFRPVASLWCEGLSKWVE